MFIKPTLLSANISGVNRPVIYKCKLFSLTSEVLDNDGNILAKQVRTSWWRLAFDMKTEEGSYKFYKKRGQYYLEHENGEVLFTHNSMDFYSKQMQYMTRLSHSKQLDKYWELNLLMDKHQSALVLASVTMCKLNPAVY